MLSNTARPVVEATLPVVGAHIDTITQRFYGHLFAEHPDLIDGTFNRGNQAAGAQQQALAGSVAAFAGALVNRPDRLPERLLARIAHKHASLAVQPEQYKVVHDHLMWAIGDVLGEAVTPDVASAWDEVYWLMANALINAERDLYRARGVQPDTTWRTWRVEHKFAETDDVDTFVVTPADGLAAPAALPGQYVTVLLPMPDGVRQPRQYSLTRADDGRNQQFTVKWVHGGGMPDGEVSTLLHHTIDVGDELTISPPYGDVVLADRARPVVCLSAGIGITPVAGMLSHLAAAGSAARVMVLHADVDERSFALRRQVVGDIAALPGASVHVWYERGAETELPLTDVFAGMMDVSQVPLPDGAVCYLCGPLPFMQAVRSALIDRGIAARDIRYEIFGPDLWLADRD
ncbi:globin domain-containing protein [Krasilnikovia sp. MM14-A1259]|uniref:globin domain-containing protein n=1 Tax=Krasilnikovia sp. MM14-A1259 TaxID=3373539 RepID=UPI003806DAB0